MLFCHFVLFLLECRDLQKLAVLWYSRIWLVFLIVPTTVTVSKRTVYCVCTVYVLRK